MAAYFNAYSTGEDSGYATFGGLSVVTYARTVYINVGGSQQRSWSIAANATPSTYTAYFSGLKAGTTYKANVVVYRNSDWTIVHSNSDTFTTDAATLKPNVAPSLYDYEITLNSFDSASGNADITVTCYYENTNDDWVIGHAQCGIDGYATSSRSDMRIYSGNTFSVSKRYTSFWVGTLPKTLTIYSYSFCYQYNDCTSTGCAMATSTRRPTYTIKLTRPSKFYWISSSSSLKSGQEISTYITASKWTSLQTNVNAVRVYKGLSNYSFTTVYSGNKITATLYNQIANAINAMKSGAVSTVNKGDPITASVMMALQNSINGIT